MWFCRPLEIGTWWEVTDHHKHQGKLIGKYATTTRSINSGPGPGPNFGCKFRSGPRPARPTLKPESGANFLLKPHPVPKSADLRTILVHNSESSDRTRFKPMAH